MQAIADHEIRARARRPKGALWCWFTLAVLVGGLLRVLPAVEKQFFWIDETISYFVATGHWATYMQAYGAGAPPIGTWTTVHDWQQFIQIEEGVGFLQTARDLLVWDIHPPLYFWLLQLWIRLVGTHFWAGSLLNLAFNLLIFLLVLAVAWLNTHRLEETLLAGSIWALSPISIRIASLTRQYVLLTFVTLIFVFLFTRMIQGRVQRHWVFWAGTLAVVAALGLLTHYLFVFVLGSALVLGLLYRTGRWSIGIEVAVAACVCVAFLGITWFSSLLPYWGVLNFLSTTDAALGDEFSGRFRRILFISILLYAPILLGILLMGVEMWMGKGMRGVVDSVRTQVAHGWRKRAHSWGFCISCFGVGPVLGVYILYILQISPRHAMAPQYVDLAVPCVALVSALILCRSPMIQLSRSIYLAVLMVVSLSLLHPAVRNFGWTPRLDPADLETTGVILLDAPSPYDWPNVVLHLDSEKEILIASQEALLAHPEQWLSVVSDRGGLYISYIPVRGRDTPLLQARRQEILETLPANVDVSIRAVLTPFGKSEITVHQLDVSP